MSTIVAKETGIAAAVCDTFWDFRLKPGEASKNVTRTQMTHTMIAAFIQALRIHESPARGAVRPRASGYYVRGCPRVGNRWDFTDRETLCRPFRQDQENHAQQPR